MTNKEKYLDQIIEIAAFNIALKDGKLFGCEDIECKECEFFDYGECTQNARKWLEEEYVAPPVDWSKVAVDAPILVGNRVDYIMYRRHFAKYENGFIYAYNKGKTSYSVESDKSITGWKYGKLAEEASNE